MRAYDICYIVDKAGYILIYPPAEKLFMEFDELSELYGTVYVEIPQAVNMECEIFIEGSASDCLRLTMFNLKLIFHTLILKPQIKYPY